MSSPFYQPARQGFSSSQNMQQPQGGFGGGFGGFQPQQQGFGGGVNFDFGGSQGFGGFQQQFNPYQGGYGGGQGFGGFQPQQQFNSFQGGFGGGFGGGYNPMFGGIGGLGFNPMMGQGFGMPMQGFNPYQQQMQQNPYQQQFIPSQQHVQFQHGQHQVSPYQQQQNTFQTQDAELTSQMQNMPEYQALQNAQKAFEGSEGYKGFQQKRQDLAAQMNAARGQQPVDTSANAFKNSQAYQDARKKAFHGGAYQQDIGKSKYGFAGNGMQTATLDTAYEDWQKSQPVQSTPQQPNVGVQAPMDAGGMPPSEQDMAQRQAQLLAMYGKPMAGVPAEMPSDSGMNRGVDNMSIGPDFGSRQPMYGGLGSLGFNPRMGAQFGMPLTADQKYQQAQQFGNQSYLNRPEVRRANEDYSRRMAEAALAARG